MRATGPAGKTTIHLVAGALTLLSMTPARPCRGDEHPPPAAAVSPTARSGERMKTAGWVLTGLGAAALTSTTIGGALAGAGSCDDIFAGPRSCVLMQGAYLAMISAGTAALTLGIGIPLVVVGTRRVRAGRGW